MADVAEPSSNISFASSSSPTSHGSPSLAAGGGGGGVTDLEVISLSRLSSNLERLLDAGFFNCTDAEVVVGDGGAVIGVHRCILAARSRFFYDIFSGAAGEVGPTGKLRWELAKLVPGGGHVGREAFVDILGYLYTGRLKPSPPEVAVCVDGACSHESCRPAIDSAVELMYVAAAFQIPELVSLFQRRLLDFVNRALEEDIIPILLVASHTDLPELLNHCIQRVATSYLDNTSLEKELPCNLYGQIKQMRLQSQHNEFSNAFPDPDHDKRVRNIHMALDSHDVPLVKLLLTESAVTLDDATALHYAAAYCDPKVVAKLLDLESANVNLKNSRGYTPLHVASMRREPDIIISLLTKGASVLETTPDGRNAVIICRRLTREKDYNETTEKGQERSKASMCIDILEREMKRNPFALEDPVAADDSITTPLLVDNFHMRLLHLENRVAFARLFFPSEAKLAMRIAEAHSTSEFAGLSATNASSKLKEVDLNETPSMRNKRLRARLDALTKTVELGRRYFPHCSQVLDKFLEDDLVDLFFLEKGTLEEQQIKRRRFCELKEDVRKAFSKDKAATAGVSSSSSSSSSLRYDAKAKQAAKKGKLSR